MRILKYTLARDKQVYFPLRYLSFLLFTRVFTLKILWHVVKQKDRPIRSIFRML